MDPEDDTGNSAGKRKRKPNFTTRELTIITENVEANKGILQSKFIDNVINKTKTETWKAITEEVNAVCVSQQNHLRTKTEMEGALQHGQEGVQPTKKGAKEDGWWTGTGRAL